MKIKLLLIFSLFVFQLNAQNSTIDERIAPTIQPLKLVQKSIMPTLDNQLLLDAEMQRRGPGIASEYAKNIDVDISPSTHGTWEDLSDGTSVWRLIIQSEGAKSLNLGFTRYMMPKKGTLILYSSDYEKVMGPFTPADNEDHEQLWTPVLDGDELVVEVRLPSKRKAELQLDLKHVNHDYIGFSQMVSGSCNLDVICGGADGWEIVDGFRDIIQSVAVIGTSGSTFCTGFLINSARQDCTPLFMTANHCGINSGTAASLVAYWNFANSTCRQPGSAASGGGGDGSLADFNTGAIFRAGWSGSDFAIVEFDDPISETADAFFAGWSAENELVQDTMIGIHHPSTDEKRISFEFDAVHIGTWGAGAGSVPDGDHVIIPDWDIGTTEGGSSGSPLFNVDRRVVGQLHGGNAACGNDSYDSYGWIAASWEGGGTPSTRLKDWLDPDGLGILVLDGRSQQACSFFVEGTPATIEVCAPSEIVYTVTATESFDGDVTLSVSGIPAGTTATFAENPISPGGSTTLTISNEGTEGNYTLILEGTDGINTNTNNLNLIIFQGSPNILSLVNPILGAMDVATSPMLTWDAVPGVSYTIEIAETSDFMPILETATNLTTNQYQSAILNTETMYFWRVKATNLCGEGDFPAPFFFTTANIFCGSVASVDVPVAILDPAIFTSNLEISSPGFIDDLNISNLVINHTWIGDLVLSITSPQGTTVLLYNGDIASCDADNLELGFDDQSLNDYDMLINLCNDSPPAASGIFQSAEPLSTFNGESATGTWVLTVEDLFFGDQGQLVSWNLDICSIVADDFSFVADQSNLETCLGDAVSFNLTIGGAFDDNGVTLSTDNLPPGAIATFSENPASPGSIVTVTLENATETGGFSFQILGDDGTNQAEDGLIWNVFGPPDATNTINPINGAMDEPLSIIMQWDDILGATSYNYVLATDPDFNNIITTFPAINNSLLQNDLEYGTTYYWTVMVTNDCGETISEVFSFTTFPDLTVGLSPENQTVCVANEAIFNLMLGVGFDSDGATITAENVPGSAVVNYSMNPAPGGSTVMVTISNLITVMSGTYTINFIIEDDNGTTNVSANLIVEAPPVLSTLQTPENNDILIPLEGQTFTWEAIDDVDGYLFELSLNDIFTEIVESNSTTNTSYTLLGQLEEETVYYWRVTSTNNCGSSVSVLFNFTSDKLDGVYQLEDVSLTLQPNPNQGSLFISLSAPLNEQLAIDVFSINGQLLQSIIFDGSLTQHQIDLSAYASGIYLVKLVSRKITIVERVVLE